MADLPVEENVLPSARDEEKVMRMMNVGARYENILSSVKVNPEIFSLKTVVSMEEEGYRIPSLLFVKPKDIDRALKFIGGAVYTLGHNSVLSLILSLQLVIKRREDEVKRYILEKLERFEKKRHEKQYYGSRWYNRYEGLFKKHYLFMVFFTWFSLASLWLAILTFQDFFTLPGFHGIISSAGSTRWIKFFLFLTPSVQALVSIIGSLQFFLLLPCIRQKNYFCWMISRRLFGFLAVAHWGAAIMEGRLIKAFLLKGFAGSIFPKIPFTCSPAYEFSVPAELGPTLSMNNFCHSVVSTMKLYRFSHQCLCAWSVFLFISGHLHPMVKHSTAPRTIRPDLLINTRKKFRSWIVYFNVCYFLPLMLFGVKMGFGHAFSADLDHVGLALPACYNQCRRRMSITVISFALSGAAELFLILFEFGEKSLRCLWIVFCLLNAFVSIRMYVFSCNPAALLTRESFQVLDKAGRLLFNCVDMMPKLPSGKTAVPIEATLGFCPLLADIPRQQSVLLFGIGMWAFATKVYTALYYAVMRESFVKSSPHLNLSRDLKKTHDGLRAYLADSRDDLRVNHLRYTSMTSPRNYTGMDAAEMERELTKPELDIADKCYPLTPYTSLMTDDRVVTEMRPHRHIYSNKHPD